MEHRDLAVRVSGAVTPALAGLAAGAVHSCVETGLARWLGLQLTSWDLLLQALVFSSLGAATVGALGLVLALFAPQWFRELADRLTVSLELTAVVYGLTLFWIVAARAGAATALVWLAPTVAAAFVLGRLGGRSGRWGSAVGALLAMSAIFCGVQLAQGELAALGPGQTQPFLLTLLGCLIPLAAFGAWWAWSWRWSPAGPAATLAAFLVGGFFAGPQSGYFGRTTLRAPTLGAPAESENIVLIVLDTVRADHLDLFGYERETMPLLAQRARRDFDIVQRSQSVASWTVPSHASMFTGRYPWAHGARHARLTEEPSQDFAYFMDERAPTLAGLLAQNGYATAGIAANHAMLGSYGLGRGFEHLDVAPGLERLAWKMLWIYQINEKGLVNFGSLLTVHLPEFIARKTGAFDRFSPQYRRASEIQEASTAWLDGRSDERPFFLFLNFLDAHVDYRPLPEDDIFVPPPSGMNVYKFREDRNRHLDEGVEPDPRDLEYYIGQYDAELRGLDRGLEGLFADLEARGLYDDSLIIVVADHGEAFLEHGMLEHQSTLYQTQTEVPLLVKLPETFDSSGLTVSPLMQQVDLVPTIAEVIGMELPERPQGSAWGGGRGHTLSELYCWACSEAPGRNDPVRRNRRARRDAVAVVRDGVKVVISSDAPIEAFDLALDPEEQRPLPEIPAHLQEAALKIAQSRVYKKVSDISSRSPEAMENLRSLGYIQ